MGSFFAGVKAGTLAGIVYIGSLALFNVALLYLFKADVLGIINQSYSQVCAPVATNSSVNIEDCFSSVVVVYIPFIAFLGYFVTLAYSAIFGRFYEHIPGGRPWAKGLTFAVISSVTRTSSFGFATTSFPPALFARRHQPTSVPSPPLSM